MKNYIFLFIFFFDVLTGSSQTPTFNGEFIFGEQLDDEYFTQVIEMPDGYLIAGTSYIWNNVFSSLDSRLIILKLDYYGNILRKVTYGDSGYAYSAAFYKGILKNETGNIVLLLSLFSGNNDNRIILMELTPDGDSISTKEIIRPAGYEGFLFPSSMTGAADKGYYIAGTYGYTGAIIKTDSSCNVEWIKLLGENSIHSVMNVFSLLSLPDTGIATGYFVYDAQGPQHSGNVCRIDKEGEVKWYRSFGPQDDFFYQDEVLLAPAEDTSMLVFSDFFVPGSSSEKRFEILKLNPDGSIYWDRNIGTHNQYVSLSDAAMLKDSTWLISGFLDTGKSFILNVNPEADSLFYREYSLTSARVSEENRLLHNYFYSVTGTRDDGLLMAGGTNSEYINFNHDPWVVKTDRYGCLQPGCEPHAIYITSQPASFDLCPGGAAMMFVSVPADSVSFHWQVFNGIHWQNITDNQVFTGSQNDSLMIVYSKEMTDDIKIRCMANNRWFTEYSNEAALRMLEPAGITRQPENQYVHLHESAMFSVQPAGTGPFSYQWYWKNKPVENARDSIFVIEDVVEEDIPGPYHCVVRNACNESESTTASIMLSTEGIHYPGIGNPVEVYPNPAKGKVHVKINYEPRSVFKIRLIDPSGLTVYKCTSHESEIVLNIADFPAGIYFLEVRSEEYVLIRKVIFMPVFQ
jgi:hypothetical protein